MGQYRFTDPQVEQTASMFTQQRLEGIYYEARARAEQRALRGYGTLAGWATSLLFFFGLLAAMTLTNGVSIITGIFLAAAVLPGTYLSGQGVSQAQHDARLCGVKGAYTRLLLIDFYLVGLPGLVALLVLALWHGGRP